jgi:Protein of unknown function (DUF3606)
MRASENISDETCINTAYEVRFWAEKFKVSSHQLRAAIKIVGNSVAAVAQQLRSK